MNDKRIGKVCRILVLLFLPKPALADAGIPMIAFSFPIMAYLFIFVICIEFIYVRRRLSINLRSAISGLIKANLATTLLGFPLTWLFAFLVEMTAWSVLSRGLEHHPRIDRWLDTPVGQILTSVLSAAWLGPKESKVTIATAFLVLLIPSFFISAWAESKILRGQGWDVDGTRLKEVIWRANLWSYLFLAVAGTALLLYRIR